MKIAVPFDNGMIYQHFGKAEVYRVFVVEDGKVVSAVNLDTVDGGHDGVARFLAGLGIEQVICGGIGRGAMDALNKAGIEVCSGAAGSAALAVDTFLKGNLQSAGINCEEHEKELEEMEAEGEGCGGCGGGGCGGCGGGCGGCGGGAPRLLFEGKNAGHRCSVHYTGTLNDGTVFDSSYDRGEPLVFVCAAGQMIPGFDKACVDMEVGDIKEIHLMPEEAYGERDEKAIFTVKISDMPGAEGVEQGQHVYLYNQMGQPFPVVVSAKDEENITFDANHEMAGKELNFKIEMVEIK